jgi:hypothetical protein
MYLENLGHENGRFMLKHIAQFVKRGKKIYIVGRNNLNTSIEPHNA